MTNEIQAETFEQFASRLGIRALCRPGRTDADPSWDADHWTVTLLRKLPETGRRVTLKVGYSKGKGHHGAQPTAEGVLYSLQADVSNTDQSFEDWAADYGYDTDSRKAETIYKTCRGIAQRLQRFLGVHFAELLACEEE